MLAVYVYGLRRFLRLALLAFAATDREMSRDTEDATRKSSRRKSVERRERGERQREGERGRERIRNPDGGPRGSSTPIPVASGIAAEKSI